MSRYFFDVEDRGCLVRDEIGLDLPSKEEARRAALSALADMARDVLPDGNGARFTIRVRNDGGRAILNTTLSLHLEWEE